MTATSPPANATAVAQQFLQTLQADKTDLAALHKCLTEERQVLEQHQHDRLSRYTQLKNELTSKLDQRHQLRLQYLKNQHLEENAENWQALIQKLEKDSGLPIVPLWQTIEKQLKDCHQLLLINEKIVGHLQNNVSQFLNTLRGATGSGQTYSAKGKAEVYSNTQTITSA